MKILDRLRRRRAVHAMTVTSVGPDGVTAEIVGEPYGLTIPAVGRPPAVGETMTAEVRW